MRAPRLPGRGPGGVDLVDQVVGAAVAGRYRDRGPAPLSRHGGPAAGEPADRIAGPVPDELAGRPQARAW